MRYSLFVIISFCVFAQSFAQEDANTDSLKNDRLKGLSIEIANLTRTPLGEGDLILDQWIQFTVEERGITRTGILHFSKEDSAVVWLDDVNRSSYFYRASPSSPIITVSTKSNQGTQLTEEMMLAMGFIRSDTVITNFHLHEDAPEIEIIGKTCLGATSEITEENTDFTTVWVCKKSDLKKNERRLIKRAIEIWCTNQTAHPKIQTAQFEEEWNILGISESGFEFKILDWGTEGDFVIALDQIMVNIPGRDIKQVAKEHHEKYMENQKED